MSANDQRNLLLTSAPSGDFRITTKVTITPTRNFQHAGILVYQDDDHYLQLQRVYADGHKVEFIHEVDGAMPSAIQVGETATTLYLRIQKQGDTYTGYYSSDGRAWIRVGQYTASFSAPKVGIGATDDPAPPITSYHIPADFDFFRLEAKFPAFEQTWTDDFSSTTLDSRWSWINEDASKWSLSAHPGFLRLMTYPGFVGDKNLLVQSAPRGYFEISTRIIFTPTHNFHIAGLVLFQDRNNYLMLGRAYCGYPPPGCVGNGIYLDRVEGGQYVGGNFATPTTITGEAYLRVIREGTSTSATTARMVHTGR